MDKDVNSFEIFWDGITLKFVQALLKEDLNQQINMIKELHKLLDKGFVPSIDELIQTDIISCLYELLNMPQNDEVLKIGIAGIIQKITTLSADHRKLANHIGVPYLIKFLIYGPKEVYAQSLKILSFLADEGTYYRDMMLDYEILPPLLRLVVSPTETAVATKASQLLYYLCQGKHGYPDYNKVKSIYPVATTLLKRDERIVLLYACLTLSSLAEGCSTTTKSLVSEEPCDSLLPLLTNESSKVVEAASDALSKIVKTLNNIIQVLKFVPLLLRGRKTSICKIACTILTIKPEGRKVEELVKSIYDMKIYPTVIDIVNNGHPETAPYAMKALSFGVMNGKYFYINDLVNIDCILCLCKVLQNDDIALVDMSLDCLEKMLNLDKIISNTYAYKIKTCNGLAAIKKLHRHPDLNISRKASFILTEYFN